MIKLHDEGVFLIDGSGIVDVDDVNAVINVILGT